MALKWYSRFLNKPGYKPGFNLAVAIHLNQEIMLITAIVFQSYRLADNEIPNEQIVLSSPHKKPDID